MSDGPSTRDHRITKTCFRTCSTYMSRSQAPLYLYALHAIANRIEGTFVLLRYLLGGDRPSQTAQLTLFPSPIQGIGLELKHDQTGISHCDSLNASAPRSQSPSYTTQDIPQPNISLQ